MESKSDWEKHEEKLKKIDKNLQELSSEIKNLMGKSNCKNDSHCRVLGLGAKSCEGYSNFIIFSTLDAPESKINSLVEEFNAEDLRYSELSMKAQECGEAPKTPHCINNICTVTEK